MRNLITAIMIPAVCFTLAADSTGRITGKVTTKDGQPIPGAVITLNRIDINWTKEIKSNDKGSYIQVGLEAKPYKLSVTVTGYQTYREDIAIPLSDVLVRNITLLTNQEAAAEALKAGAANMAPGDAKSMAGTAAFNSGVEFYNQQKYAEALPFMEKAVADLREALATMKDGDAKSAIAAQTPMAERVYGICLNEVGKADPEKKDLVLKSEPFLSAAYEKNPKDQRLILGLLEVAKAKNDQDGVKKYQAAIDAIIGPRPELAYNDGVGAFNAGDFKKAKICVDKAIATDPKFADSYWLLGVVQFSLNDLKGAKEAFKKYMEIAPTGKKAGEVKEFLKELK